MILNSAEIGERYADNSGWEKRVFIDIQEGKLEIELSSSMLYAHPRDIQWLLMALTKAARAVCEES